MPDQDFELDLDDLKRRMDGAMSALKSEFASLRTGRASASMLDPVTVEAYGQRMPINQVGTVNVPEPRMVTVNVWDKSMVGKVEKAIRESGLGINPQLNGTIIMLPIPELNEERRRELTRVVARNMPNTPLPGRRFTQTVRRDRELETAQEGGRPDGTFRRQSHKNSGPTRSRKIDGQKHIACPIRQGLGPSRPRFHAGV